MSGPDPYPSFSKHYDHLMAVADRLNRAAWASTAKPGRSLRQRQRLYSPSEEAEEILRALGHGEEHTVKALFLRYL